MVETKTDKLKITIKLPKIYGYIYATRNLIDGKYYIGQHKSNSLDNDYLGSGKYLKRAIKYHGKENFKKEILAICDNQEQLNNREIWFIEYAKAKAEHDNYNIVDGGNNSLTIDGKGFNHGKAMTEDQKQKISLKVKGNKNPACIGLYSIDEVGTVLHFDFLKEASDYFNINHQSLSYRLKLNNGKWINSSIKVLFCYDNLIENENINIEKCVQEILHKTSNKANRQKYKELYSNRVEATFSDGRKVVGFSQDISDITGVSRNTINKGLNSYSKDGIYTNTKTGIEFKRLNEKEHSK